MATTDTTPLRMTLSLSDERMGRQILRCLANADESETEFTIHSIGTDERPSSVQISNITGKQWEAATLAVEMGYYQMPKEATLGDLADELGVSKSAVSQRLGNLERSLVCNLVTQETG